MEVPVIRVDDWSDSRPRAVKYMKGDDELDFKTVWLKVKNLRNHAGRGTLLITINQPGSSGAAPGVVPTRAISVQQCTDEFLSLFWQCGAHLLDYFADFHEGDTPMMQSMWFHLLEELQETAQLPHAFWHANLPHCDHARQFGEDFKEMLDIIDKTIDSRTKHREKLDTEGEQEPEPAGPHNYHHCRVHPDPALTEPSGLRLGGYKAGMKPWGQFLFNRSPGFTVPLEHRTYKLPRVTPQFEEGARWSVPRGAMAIIERHKERYKAIAEKLVRKEATAEEVEGKVAAKLQEIEQNSIQLGRPTAYTSITGHEMLVQPMHPDTNSLDAPRRQPGYADPSLLVGHPSLGHLDDAAGIFRGIEPFAHPDGNQQFHMWDVSASKNKVPGAMPSFLDGPMWEGKSTKEE